MAEERARGREPLVLRRAARQQVLVLAQRDVMRRPVKDAHPEVAETGRVRRAPERVHVHVALDDPVGVRLELRARRLRVARAGLGKSGDPAVHEHARELADHGVRIGGVVKGVEADDPVDASVGKGDPPPVELEELRRGLRRR